MIHSFFKYLVFSLFICFSAAGQEKEVYKGGMEKYYKLLQKNIRFPAYERRMGVEGSVVLKFRINETGSVDSVAVVNSVSQGLDEEAVRVFKLTGGQWNVEPNEFYLMPMKFQMAGSPISSELLKRERDRLLEQGDMEGMLFAGEEIRRRFPFEFDNLELLRDTYQKLSKNNKSEEIAYLINELKTVKRLK